MKNGYVYILANRKLGTTYLGVTSNLVRRTYEHRGDDGSGFSQRYNTKRLVYFETHHRIDDAIAREKQLKKWRRTWKIALIEAHNPEWEDLWPTIIGPQ